MGAFACVPEEIPDRYASVVDLYLPTPGLNTDEPFMNPERALGPPDGRTVALARGSALVLRFFQPIHDVEGADLSVLEVGPLDEASAVVAASSNGERFHVFEHTAIAGRASLFDLAEVGLEEASFIRLLGLDASIPASSTDDPGFDLDAVEAFQ
ncbi:MAG: hypothetical protein HY791_18880 [Deltaproteobacteria bacterium]|nr:hypothetical protein [Deltaproteobacteria bacterium]